MIDIETKKTPWQRVFGDSETFPIQRIFETSLRNDTHSQNLTVFYSFLETWCTTFFFQKISNRFLSFLLGNMQGTITPKACVSPTQGLGFRV